MASFGVIDLIPESSLWILIQISSSLSWCLPSHLWKLPASLNARILSGLILTGAIGSPLGAGWLAIRQFASRFRLDLSQRADGDEVAPRCLGDEHVHRRVVVLVDRHRPRRRWNHQSGQGVDDGLLVDFAGLLNRRLERSERVVMCH